MNYSILIMIDRTWVGVQLVGENDKKDGLRCKRHFIEMSFYQLMCFLNIYSSINMYISTNLDERISRAHVLEDMSPDCTSSEIYPS